MKRIAFNYQENIDFIREKQSQYYLEKSESVQKQMSEYNKMENKFQIRKVHQDYYKDNVYTLKKKTKCIMSEIDQKLGKDKNTITIIAREITAGNNKVKTYTKKSLSGSESYERIELFHKPCREGPTFICVTCNRCLYQKSVRKFDRNNYSDLDSEKFPEISNKGIYICLTCHGHFKK